MEHTIDVTVHNRTGEELRFRGGKSEKGDPAKPLGPGAIPPGGSLVVRAYDKGLTSASNKGVFHLDGAGLGFTIGYDHPWNKAATHAEVQDATGAGVGEADAADYGGDPARAAITLYRGVPVAPAKPDTGYAVPLDAKAYGAKDTVRDFVNSLFHAYPSRGGTVRRLSAIADAVDQRATPFAPADFSGQIADRILPMLTALWMGEDAGQGAGPGQAQDRAILQFLGEYLAPNGKGEEHDFRMWLPEIRYVGVEAKPPKGKQPRPVYALDGYREAPPFRAGGKWNRAGVETFLSVLLGGAHIVAISAKQDLDGRATGPDAIRNLDALFASSGLPTRSDPGNSHYCGDLFPTNVTGNYYLRIGDDFAPPGAGFLLALLIGRTVNGLLSPAPGDYNSFLQLEGWQANGLSKKTRHMIDYKIHEDTVWNISTFGASPYSEKRATAVFLAPQGWVPRVDRVTRMMRYVGAYPKSEKKPEPQGWLETGLVEIPRDTP